MEKYFSHRLVQLRTALKLDKTDMAKRMGVSKRVYQLYENGDTVPGVDKVTALLDSYAEINSAWLLLGQPPMLKSEAETLCEPRAPDIVTEKILLVLQDLDEEDKRDVLKYLEKEKRRRQLEQKIEELERKLDEGA